MVDAGVRTVVGWICVLNQIRSGFFFLLAFYLLLRHIETGRNSYYLAQWAAFVCGIGALETNVVYPALAAVYTLLFAKPMLKKILPMFLVSALAVLIHFRFAPLPTSGAYALHLDAARIITTLWTYWTWALGPPRLAIFRPTPWWMVALVIAVLTAAALAFAAVRACRGDYTGVFGI